MNVLTPEQEKINELNRKAWEIRVSDSLRCGHLSEEAIELSRAINYRKGLAEGLRTYGFALIRHSRHEHAMELLEQAMIIFLETGDEFGQSDIHEYYGIIARSKGDYKSSLEHLYTAYQLRKDNHYTEGEALALYHLGLTYRYLGNLEKALDFFLQCLDFGRKYKHWVAESYSINYIGSIYLELDRPEEALVYFQKSLEIREAQGDQWGAAGCLDNIGRSYFMLKEFGKANEYFLQGFGISTSVDDKKGEGNALIHLAEFEMTLSNHDLAYEYASRCLSIRKSIGDKKGQAEALLMLIDMSPDRNTLPMLKNALELATVTGSTDLFIKVHFRYYEYYKKNHAFEKALEHLEIYDKAAQEFHSKALTQKIANLQMVHHVERSQKETEIYRLRNIELAGLYKESELQKKDIATAMEVLKSTQEQLVQREKLASLGELTTGLAHEIQNPLNFVNNFAASGSALIEEMNAEMRRGNHAEVMKIAGDLKNNLKKINFHGERADAIVKSMFQHSQISTGEKQLTDINNLVDEYLRLAYHSMRSKDKSFNVEVELHYENSVREISINPQQIGRVIFNILNNAFYAINEKRIALGAQYEPKIIIRTKRELRSTIIANDKDPSETSQNSMKDTPRSVLITITDNGHGIPEEITDKIFQPFFTTKPAGEGTGLGLSLSYEIITKGHGGSLIVESKENEFSRFIIELPVLLHNF